MKAPSSLFFIVAFVALIVDHGMVVSASTDTSAQDGSRLKVRGRRARGRRVSAGKIRRTNATAKSSHDFTHEQLQTYRRLGINCGGYNTGGGKDNGKDGYGNGKDGYGYGKDGYGKDGYGNGKDGYGYGKDGYGNGKDGYGKDGGMEGKDGRRRNRHHRRLNMRAIRSEECVCSDDLGVCWRLEWGDTGDDKVCCVPDAAESEGDDDSPIPAPTPFPTPVPPANLAPPVAKLSLSNDDPTESPSFVGV